MKRRKITVNMGLEIAGIVLLKGSNEVMGQNMFLQHQINTIHFNLNVCKGEDCEIC